MRSRPNRRDLLRAAGGLAAGSMLSGCGFVRSGFTGAPLPGHVLTYWDLLGGGDGVRMQAMQEEFRRSHPDIELAASTLTWGNPYYTKLSLATLGAQPPDLAVSHLTRVPTLAAAGLLDPFPADDLERHGISRDKFVRNPIDSATIDGELYAVPLDTHPFVMFYNTEICERAGLLNEDGELVSLDGPDAFVDAMARAQRETGVSGGVLATIGDYATPWRFFYTLYSQLGGELLNGQTPRELVAEEPALQALRFARRLTVEERVFTRNMDYPAAIAQFVGGRCAFYFQGEWEVSTFIDAKVPFSMARFPQIFGKRYRVQGDSHTFVLPRRAGPDPRKRAMALDYVRSMLDHSLIWAEGGHIPAWLPVRDGRAYRDLKPQSNYADVAEDVVYHPPAWFSGSGSNLEQVVGHGVGAVVRGHRSPERALARIRQQILELVRTEPPVEGVNDESGG